MINWVLEDPEIKTVIDYLKNKLETLNYEYEEANKGNLMTFLITINNQIVIEPGFSNTIEVRFKDKNFKSVHIIYKNTNKGKLESQLDKLCSLIDDYFNWNINFNDMSVSKLYDYLRHKGYYLMVNTPYFMEKLTEDFPIFDTFVIEDRYDEYK